MSDEWEKAEHSSAVTVAQVQKRRIRVHADPANIGPLNPQIVEFNPLLHDSVGHICARQGWPVIDVTRRSIEETAAAIVALYAARKAEQ